MTVIAIETRQHRIRPNSDADRLRLTAKDLLFRARDLVQFYGHFSGDGFGCTRYGLSLDGAVYTAARFWDGRALLDPYRCSAHRRGRHDLPRACDSDCEDPLWRECNLAFSYLAAGLRTPREHPVVLTTVQAAPRDWIEVVEANPRLNHNAAMTLLNRVCWALGPRNPGAVRPLAGAA